MYYCIALALLAFIPLVSPAAYCTYHNYNAGDSLTTVACSDGANGIMTKMKYTTLSAMYPYVTAFSGATWNSPNCGKCVQLTNSATGKSVYLTVIDQCGAPGGNYDAHFDIAPPAFQQLFGTAGVNAGSGSATWKFVASNLCQGNKAKAIGDDNFDNELIEEFDAAVGEIEDDLMFEESFDAAIGDEVVDDSFDAAIFDEVVDEAAFAVVDDSFDAAVFDEVVDEAAFDEVVDEAAFEAVGDEVIEESFDAAIGDEVVDESFDGSIQFNDAAVGDASVDNAAEYFDTAVGDESSTTTQTQTPVMQGWMVAVLVLFSIVIVLLIAVIIKLVPVLRRM